MTMRVLTVLLLTLVVSLSTASPARAYIDPGTGSYILQILAAALFGALFGLKMFWAKIRSFLSRGQRPTEEDDGRP